MVRGGYIFNWGRVALANPFSFAGINETISTYPICRDFSYIDERDDVGDDQNLLDEMRCQTYWAFAVTTYLYVFPTRFEKLSYDKVNKEYEHLYLPVIERADSMLKEINDFVKEHKEFGRLEKLLQLLLKEALKYTNRTMEHFKKITLENEVVNNYAYPYWAALVKAPTGTDFTQSEFVPQTTLKFLPKIRFVSAGKSAKSPCYGNVDAVEFEIDNAVKTLIPEIPENGPPIKQPTLGSV